MISEQKDDDSPPPKTLHASVRASLFPVNALALDDWLVAGSDEGLIRVWADPQTTVWTELDLKQINQRSNTVTPALVLRGHAGPVTRCSLRGAQLVSGGEDGWLFGFNLARAEELFPSTTQLNKLTSPTSVHAHSARVNAVQFHPLEDMPLVASSGADRCVSVWRLGEGRSIFDSHPKPLHLTFTCASPAQHLLWHPTDKNKLLTAFDEGAVGMYDVATEKLVGTIEPGPSGVVVGITSYDAQILLGHASGKIRLIDLKNASAELVIEILTPAALTCLTGQGFELYTGHEDGCVKLWDLRSYGSPVNTLVEAHQGPVRSLCVQRGVLVSAGADGRVNIHK